MSFSNTACKAALCLPEQGFGVGSRNPAVFLSFTQNKQLKPNIPNGAYRLIINRSKRVAGFFK